MFDRFSNRSRKIMGLARQEAQRLKHEYIGTEHMLLGLLQEGEGVGVRVLKDLGFDPQKIAKVVERRLVPGTGLVTMGQLPFTPRAKDALVASMEEAVALGDAHIGTEHILLGLLVGEDGIAVEALREAGVAADTVREQIRAADRSATEIPALTVVSSFSARVPALFTPAAAEALGAAYALASRREAAARPLHLLAGVLTVAGDRRKDPSLAGALKDVDLADLAKRANAAIRVGTEDLRGRAAAAHGPALLLLLGRAIELAAGAGRNAANLADLLAALVEDPKSPSCALLVEAGVDPARWRRTASGGTGA